MAKLNISMDDELLKRVDSTAQAMYMSRSGLIAVAVVNYINANEITANIKEMTYLLRKVADSGDIDDATLKQMEDLERVCKMLLSNK